MDFNNGNSLRMTEQEDIYDRGNLEPLNKLFLSRFTIFTGLRCFRLDRGCLREPKPILRYALDECLIV